MIRLIFFETKNEAQLHSDSVNSHLLTNRVGYNAERWTDLITALNGKWVVEQPVEFPEFSTEYIPNIEGIMNNAEDGISEFIGTNKEDSGEVIIINLQE